MNKILNYIKGKHSGSNKISIIIYYTLRALIILVMILQIILGNYSNALLCLFTIFTFTLPTFISKKLKIKLPNVLETIIYIMIFSSAVLGEINNFYRVIPFWDTILHTLNGFICAGIGFSLVDMLNENSKNINLSPFYLAVVAFCFSMTIGIVWEFCEFSMDSVFKTDMQKDTLVQSISSIAINDSKENNPVKVNNIDKTEIYTKDGNVVTINGGYIDIGIIDTMKDLFVNMIGAITFSIIGYIYKKNKGNKFASNFIQKKINEDV